MAGGNHLGHDLAEDQNNKRNAQCAGQQHQIIGAEHAQNNNAGERGSSGIEQGVAKQDGAEQLICTGQQLCCELGALVSFAYQMVQAQAIQRHHAGFGSRKKCGTNQNDYEGNKQRAQ